MFNLNKRLINYFSKKTPRGSTDYQLFENEVIGFNKNWRKLSLACNKEVQICVFQVKSLA